MTIKNDEQDVPVQDLPVNEPTASRLLSYELNERWETDEEIKRKAMDVSFVILLLHISCIFIHSYYLTGII